MFYNKSDRAKELIPILSLDDCLAKTYYAKDGDKCGGRDVLTHCLIVGEVAREIIERTPAWLAKDLFPEGSELVAAIHDIGKISPTFQKKIYSSLKKPLDGLEKINVDLEKEWGGHAGTSQAAIKNNKLVGKYIPEIIGQHHGYTPNLSGKKVLDEIFGSNEWQKQREECISKLQSKINCFVWPQINNDGQALAISGLTTVSDWIGSGSCFDDPKEDWQPLIKGALDNVGFVSPKLKMGLAFSDVFGFKPKDAQQKLFESVINSGVYIMEAPMGLGKTEAALYAAYLAMRANKATGIYFALPTQLTSDKIHERVNSFLEKILEPNCIHREALLLHSLAWLKFGADGEPGGSWFDVGKRGILAPFAVGTIDQSLMAAMNVKHGFVRSFGLAGKVVILDEVHSYDIYTGTILDELIKKLRELHCTVIILSATLTEERRKSLLSIQDQQICKADYPLITIFPKNQQLHELSSPLLTEVKVALKLVDQDQLAIEEALLRAEQGQQILWVENTVDEAQKIYRLLAAKSSEINVGCGLLHSRFLKIDREIIEREWIKFYGKENPEGRLLQGRILVGTQVLEQSLDIDADFIVTRFCPTDMLLQRIGRLWRHDNNTPRPKSASRESWILVPKLELEEVIKNPKKAFGKTANIYAPYVLCRAFEIWKNFHYITLPKDIRLLIEATYKERNETNELGKLKDELKERQEKLQKFALIGISKSGKTFPENKASTRYNEQDSVELLLIHSYRESKSGVNVTLFGDRGSEEIYLPRNVKELTGQEWRNIAFKLIKNTLHVAEYLAPGPISKKNLEWLKSYMYLGSKSYNESLLRVALLQKSGELKSLDGGEIASKSYNQKFGYYCREDL